MEAFMTESGYELILSRKLYTTTGPSPNAGAAGGGVRASQSVGRFMWPPPLHMWFFPGSYLDLGTGCLKE